MKIRKFELTVAAPDNAIIPLEEHIIDLLSNNCDHRLAWEIEEKNVADIQTNLRGYENDR